MYKTDYFQHNVPNSEQIVPVTHDTGNDQRWGCLGPGQSHRVCIFGIADLNLYTRCSLIMGLQFSIFSLSIFRLLDFSSRYTMHIGFYLICHDHQIINLISIKICWYAAMYERELNP